MPQYGFSLTRTWLCNDKVVRKARATENPCSDIFYVVYFLYNPEKKIAEKII